MVYCFAHFCVVGCYVLVISLLGRLVGVVWVVVCCGVVGASAGSLVVG